MKCRNNSRVGRPRRSLAYHRAGEGHAPGRHPTRARGGRHRRRRRAGDRAGARARRARRAPAGRGARPRAPADRRRAAGDHHREERARCARRDPPRRRARAGHRRDGALPGREDLDRAADRGRLLLRLRVPRGRHRHRGRLPGHRGADARAHQGRRGVRARRGRRRRGARALPGGRTGLQGRADRGPRPRSGDRQRLALHQRAVHRPLPRPACPVDRADRCDQAPVGRRRVLARRREPHDAHPRLRHGVLRQEGPCGRARAPRAGPRARPPQARPRARPVHLLRRLAGVGVLAAQGHDHLERARRALTRDGRGARVHRGQDAPALRQRAVEDLRPLGQVPREHVHHRNRGARVRPQADELPRSRAPVQHAAVELPRPAGSLRRAGPAAPQRAQRHAARAAARAALHPGRRAHLLHRGADRGGGPALPGAGLRDLRDLRIRGRARAVHPPRRADRQRRDVGSRGGRARAGAARGPDSTTSSIPATAPSTGRRSTCTRPTPSGAPGSSAPSSWTTRCPSASGSATSAPTTPSTGR